MDVNMRELVANEISISQPSSSCDIRQAAGMLLAASNSDNGDFLHCLFCSFFASQLFRMLLRLTSCCF